jgi:ectoine hydroxylase-related dioxygenase (phytanoyl-CoA dioxygenase family)
VRFGASPTPDFEVTPTDEDVRFFRDNGFVSVARITTDEELDWLGTVYDACFDAADEAAARTRWDEETAETGAVTTRSQAFFPEVSFPELLDTAYRRNGRRFAAAFMDVGEAELTTWSHMLDKPAGIGRPTYWHQDEAYWEPAVAHRALGAWMPLTDCTIEMGCMQFIPGSHLTGLRPHLSRRPDIRPDLYEVAEDVDDSVAVACPLPAGGATFHHSLTLHYTAPNVSTRDRRAYAIEFETRPIVRDVPLDKPWVAATRALLGEPTERRYLADGEWRSY